MGQYLNLIFTSIAMIFAFVIILIVAVGGVGSFQECRDDNLERFFLDSPRVNTRKATKGTVKKYETWRNGEFKSSALLSPLLP
jgi:Na+-transporting methylmalonyl-CoA/oxaloacetate decarboxylase gamma subunit